MAKHAFLQVDLHITEWEERGEVPPRLKSIVLCASRERERGSSVGLADSLVGGILGRAAGAVFSGAMRQLQDQQQQVCPFSAPCFFKSPRLRPLSSHPLLKTCCSAVWLWRQCRACVKV
jgi:hypothetical protein